MALSYVRCLLLRSTFAATAPRSAVAELWVVRRRYAMRLATFICSFVALASAACVEPYHTASPKPRMTERQVLAIAMPVMNARFPALVAAHQPYRAKFSNGNWWVLGNVPKGIRGGGAPEATVRDLDGKLLGMSLSR